MKILTTSSVEQHASWLASNPVVGCPMNCAYCFLRPEGLNSIKPRVLFSPENALMELTASEYYTTNVPVAVGTRTDFFVTPSNIEYITAYITEYNKRSIPNPLILITKQEIPQSFVQFLKLMNERGTRCMIFLSYSGLDASIEKGIHHEKIRETFRFLSEKGIKVIHYWRPLIPQNSTRECVENVSRFVSRFSKASVVTGLKFTPEMKEQLWFWPELQELELDLSGVEGIWSKGIESLLCEVAMSQPERYLGYATSCAISTVLEKPDYNGFYGSSVCLKSFCPKGQREICRKANEARMFSNAEVESVFERLGIASVKYRLSDDKTTLTLESHIPHSKIVNITQSLNVRVCVEDDHSDSYGWGSSVSSQKESLYL